MCASAIQPITSFDVQQRAKMLRTFTRGQQGEKEALEQLIEERLMLQEAKRRNVDFSDAEVDAEFAKRARAANHYDMQGHGERAEQLLREAERELHEAVEAAKKH